MIAIATSAKDVLLRAIEQRVLWLAANIVHHANHVRPNVDGLKVGGHQTSSASVVTVLTALYFDFLRAGDKVSIKPHASPVFHAIQYLLGKLDKSYLTTLRQFGGLQSYPSRTKDPDEVDFSTGSVGIGSIAPNFAALAHDYLCAHELVPGTGSPRFVSLLGDAELDEGSIWEAVADTSLQGLKRVLWVVDLNRQSLDRVIPGIRTRGWVQMFRANGWNVIEAKYGEKLQAAFARPNGGLLLECLNELSNEAYQRLLRAPAGTLREWLPAKSRDGASLAQFLDQWNDPELAELFGNLGGHDFGALRSAFAAADAHDGPTVVFAYTLKGWSLPTVGHPQNHSALLTPEQMRAMRVRLGIDEEWPRFAPASDEFGYIEEIRERLAQVAIPSLDKTLAVPNSAGCVHVGSRSTQQTFGIILTALGRDCPDLARRLVTVSPDVASSTNLGGWINKCGVWRKTACEEKLPVDAEQSAIQWRESSRGQHIELGISENNLFMALGQLGLTRELFGELLIPIGTLYDPFVRRGLDAFYYGVYSGSRFIVVGTPSGITLAPEGGAHQSLGCQSIGTEMPDLDSYEPCFGMELEWILLHSVREVVERRRSCYLRLSTRPVDQGLFPKTNSETETDVLRDSVIAGAYRIVDRSSSDGYDPVRNVVNIFACGAVLPNAIEASSMLLDEGLRVNVFNITGPGPLFRDYHESRRLGSVCHLESLLGVEERGAPAVTLIDDHPHALAWIGGLLGSVVHPLGVARFGQSGNLIDLYREYGLDAAAIAEACRSVRHRSLNRERKGDCRLVRVPEEAKSS